MKEIISTDSAPAAIGPYSQAVRVSGQGMLFCSGQIPLDPKSGDVIGKTAGDQCRQVMKNLEAVLKASGAGFSDVVKTTIFLTDMADFGEVNEIYAGCFDSEPPARSTVQVSRLPKDVRVKIEAIAVI
ncbi:MAG: reactive intermediate/imine deaminase [Candidatus Zixiibacteriota bacterium]|nr:MAG: reactive intermediate/imine deaminase [candidate division Zixibacteria bacterium]